MRGIHRIAMACALSLGIAAVWAPAAIAQSASYDFVKIHEDQLEPTIGGVPRVPLALPVINSTGVVAFRQKPTTIVAGSGGSLTLLADTVSQGLRFLSAPGGLHADGTVVFWGGDGSNESPQRVFGGIGTGFSHKSGPGLLENVFPGMNADYTVVAPARLLLEGDPLCADYYAIQVPIGKQPFIVMDCTHGLRGLGKQPAPRINNAGTVAFLGLLADGDAILTAPFDAAGAVTRVADQAGGFFGFSEPALNNAGTIAFAAGLRSGGAGVFTWSGGVLETVVHDGIKPFAAPFSRPAINDRGQLAFISNGVLYSGPRGALTRVIGVGDVLFGLTVTALHFFEGLNDAGQLAFLADFGGGHFAVVRADPRGGATVPGSDVVVQPVDPVTNTAPVTLTFDDVTGAGTTTVTTSAAGAPPPGGLKLGNPPTYYEIATTATFNGSITVCINYGNVSFGNENTLKLMHNTGGGWVDITTSRDAAANVICGTTASLSPFAIFEREYEFSGFQSPVASLPAVNSVNAGAALPVKFGLGGNQGLDILKPGFPSARQVTCTAGLPGPELAETETASQSGLRYDAASDQYVYVWKTDRSWGGTCWQFDLGLNDNSSHSILVQFPSK